MICSKDQIKKFEGIRKLRGQAVYFGSWLRIPQQNLLFDCPSVCRLLGSLRQNLKMFEDLSLDSRLLHTLN